MQYFCSKDCPDTCSFDLTLSPDGQPVFLPERRPYASRPFVCAKLRGFFEVESSLSPSSFVVTAGQRVDIESKEAVGAAAELIRRHRNGRILYLRGSGSLSCRMGAWDELFARLDNAWFVEGSPCDETGILSHQKDFSVCVNPPVERLEEADTILLFGKNAKVISPHLYVYLKALSEKGACVVLIDPVQTETSRIANRYIRITPGTDGVLSAAILSRLNLVPGLNWKDLRDKVGLTTEDFKYLCDIFSRKGKTALITGYSLQRYSNGMNAVRWINRLAVLTENEALLYYGKSSREGIERPAVTPANHLSIADLPRKLREDFFDLVIVVGANPCVTYPESAVWIGALATAPLIAIDVRDTETTAHANVFLRVSGMFGQGDVQGSYFFKDGVRMRPEGFLHHHPNDADMAALLAETLGVPIRVKKASEIGRTADPPPRHYTCEGLDVIPPLIKPGYRLLTVSHPLFLNSQIPPELLNRDACIYISEEVAASEELTDGQVLRVKNDIGFFDAPCRVTSHLKGPVILAYKNRPLLRNGPNHVVESRVTDAGNGLDYYDTFVRLEKI